MHKSLDNTTNLKKLTVFNDIIGILNSNKPLDTTLRDISEIIPNAYEHPENVSVKIMYDNKEYVSNDFKKTGWLEREVFITPDDKEGVIEIYFSREYMESIGTKGYLHDNKYLTGISTIINGAISKTQLEKLYYNNRERLKELKGIKLTSEILNKGATLDESLQEICSLLPEAWQYPEYTVARIIYEDQVFTSKNFKETRWSLKESFETPGNKKGSIEIFYLKEFPPSDEGPFLKEERNLIQVLASIISGTASRKSLHELILQNTERLKELRGINQTSYLLKQGRPIEEALAEICSILPDAWQYPEYTVARIKYENKVFVSKNFKETTWVQSQTFETPGNKKGSIEIFYTKEFPKLYEGPFLEEERNLLINLAHLISGSATREVFEKLLSNNKERLKELWGINQTSQIIAEGKPIEETLHEICIILPKAWQYPRYTCAKIKYEGKEYISTNFKETHWFQKENFVTIDNKKGTIEIFYTKEFPKIYEGPFLKEERNLLINLGKLISGYINNYKGREIYQKRILHERLESKPEAYRKSLIKNKQPLQLFFNKQIIDKYIYLDMMKYKVREILFVATLYDAFILENEDSFFEQFMGEIYQFSLYSLPRVTGVTSSEEALELLETTHFDLVILMVGIDNEATLSLSTKIKNKNLSLPIYLLLNQKSNVSHFEELVSSSKTLDKLFVWQGDSQILFSIVKSIEDRANVENDTQIGLVRVILLIEDSAVYYSKYLQMLYSIVFGQVQQILPEVEKNELDKISKMRSRPKILLAHNYEEAMYIFNKYKDFLLCVISDVEFEINGSRDKKAGIKFIKHIKSQIRELPIILQSSDDENEKLAKQLNVFFINKNSESLLNDLKKYITYYLGFGDFIFRDKDGNEIAVAKTFREFEKLLSVIPDETFYLHAVKNQFSIWLMARGEIELAKILNPLRIESFENVPESRRTILEILNKHNEKKKKGRILGFDEITGLDEKNIVTFSGGSLGGKGRGLAFINTLIYNLDFESFSNKINIRTPKTAIIGTDEFDYFMDKNKLFEKVIRQTISFNDIKQEFNNAEFSPSLIKKLEFFIDQIDNPIAVRSSSLSEDSFTQPFAGVFHTYIIPNRRENKKKVLENLLKVIKLVYASIYSDEAKSFFKTIHHKVEDEKMAVILQELVGNRYENYYYPHISGTARSNNFYPVSHMKPEEGFAVTALGLGTYVVEGWKAFRFSPKYPSIQIYTTKDLLNNSQVKFFAVDCSRTDIDYIKDGELASLKLLDIREAEKHGTLKYCASVYNALNDRIEPDITINGPRVLNFARILKYNYIPLATTIEVMLNTIKEALGSPVEIEFAVDLNKTINNLPSFYLLQIKPLVESQSEYKFDIDELDKLKILIFTNSSLGNGQINNITDIIYVNTEKFDKLKTLEMSHDIEYLNNLMIKQNKHYILIGPGRWGTRDRFLGIPVNWAQISNAKVIIEISLANFPLDSSLGSHFFHNVSTMNIGYLSVLDSSKNNFIKWELLEKQEIINETKYFKHIRFKKPLTIWMNGKERTAVIFDNSQ